MLKLCQFRIDCWPACLMVSAFGVCVSLSAGLLDQLAEGTGTVPGGSGGAAPVVAVTHAKATPSAHARAPRLRAAGKKPGAPPAMRPEPGYGPRKGVTLACFNKIRPADCKSWDRWWSLSRHCSRLSVSLVHSRYRAARGNRVAPRGRRGRQAW